MPTWTSRMVVLWKKHWWFFSINVLILYYLQVNPLLYDNIWKTWRGQQPRVVEAFQAAESSWTEQSISVCKEVSSKCQSGQQPKPKWALRVGCNIFYQNYNEQINWHANKYTVYTYKEVAVLIMSLTTTLAPE